MSDGSDPHTDDALLGGRVVVRQPRAGHRAGTDAVLLAGLADVRHGDHVLDLGSASGAAGLMLAARVPEIGLTLVDVDPHQIALARENIVRNGLSGRAAALAADVLAGPAAWTAAGGPIGSADAVVTNPPFNSGAGRPSPDPGRRLAHVMDEAGLTAWTETACRALRPRGRLSMIHRADRLDACLRALSPRFGGIVLRAVHPRVDRPATRIILCASKGSRAPFAVAPPLILHEADGRFTPEAAALHAGSG